MRKAHMILLFGLLGALVASGASAQADFTKYVALGDSGTAGFASGGLTKAYQDGSFPAVLAHQFGIATFQQPLVSDPGIPSVLILQALRVTSQGVSPVIVAKSTGTGAPLNATLAGPYNNIGIPGANVNDLLTKTGNIQRLATGQSTSATVMYDLILRDNTTTAIQQAIGAQGTFYTVTAGTNDALNTVLSGVVVDGITLTTKATFQEKYTALVGALRQNRPAAGIIVATVPDVAALPFVTTVKPYLINPATGAHIPLIGESGVLTESDFVTLPASALIARGIGVPAAAGGTGVPLPEGSIGATGLVAGVILRASEVAAIRARVAEFNAIVVAVAAQTGTKVFDVAALQQDILAHGRVVGGVRLSASFLTGGLFSYDGIHLQNLGNAVYANEWIKTINAAFGTEVPEVDLRANLLGAAAATTVLAGNTQFSIEAWEKLLDTLAPGLAKPSGRRVGGGIDTGVPASTTDIE